MDYTASRHTQEEIVKYLRSVPGCKVIVNETAQLPDLLVGYGGSNYLFIVTTNGIRQEMTKFNNQWAGQIAQVRRIADCLDKMNISLDDPPF